MAHMSIIYTVEDGENGMGISSYGAFSSLAAAQAEALRRRERYRPKDWAVDRLGIEDNVVESWACGCDYISIRRMEVCS